MSFSIQYVPIEAAAGAASLKQSFLFDGSTVQVTTGQRTMNITAQNDGDLVVDCRDLLGRQVNPTSELGHTSQAQLARTHAAKQASAKRWDKPAPQISLNHGMALAGLAPETQDAVLAGIQEVLSIERTLDLGDSDDRKALAASIWESVQRHLGIAHVTPQPAEEDRAGMGKPNAATQAVIDGRLAADDGAQQRYENVEADAVKHKVTTILARHIIAPEGLSPAMVDDLTHFVHTYAAGHDTLPKDWDKNLTAQERMLSVGIRGVLGRTGGINLGDPVKRRKLAADLFDYCRKYQPATPGETVWPEWQVRESIRRAVNVVFPGAEAPIRRDTVDGILENLKHYAESPKQDETPVANIKPTTKPERKLKETIASVVNVHMDMVNPRTRAKLVNGLFHELNQAPLTQPTYDTFGGFWDAMTALRRDDAKAVLFMAGGIVYAATLGTMPDGETPAWMVNRGNGSHRPLHEYHNAPAYTILAMAADTVDVPF